MLNLSCRMYSLYKCMMLLPQVRLNRRRAGIEPYIPLPQDRPAMMSKYAETGKIPTTPDG